MIPPAAPGAARLILGCSFPWSWGEINKFLTQQQQQQQEGFSPAWHFQLQVCLAWKWLEHLVLSQSIPELLPWCFGQTIGSLVRFQPLSPFGVSFLLLLLP